MPVIFDLPEELEAHLRRQSPNLDHDAKVAFALDAYRSGKLSIGQVADALGISIYEAEGLLKDRGIVIELSETEIQEDLASLRELLNP